MATYYVKSGAGGTADGSTWINAFTTLNAALTPAVGGDTIYVSHLHSETTSGNAGFSKVASGNPVRIICVNDGALPPTTLATTAVCAATGFINVNADIYVYGVYFKCTGSGTGQSTFGGYGFTELENCTFKIGGTASIAILGTTAGAGYGSRGFFKNCAFRFSNVLNTMYIGRIVNFLGCTFGDTGDSSTNLPTVLFSLDTTYAQGFTTSQTFIGCDFSNLGSGKTLFGGTGGTDPGICIDLYLIDCKINAAVTIAGTIASAGGPRIHLKNSGSANNNYNYAIREYLGTIDIDTTQYLTLTGEAGANDGDIGYSWKMAGNTHTSEFAPLRSEWIYMRYNTTGAAKTATIEILEDMQATPITDAEVWIEIGVLTDANSPLSTFNYSDRCALLSAPAAQTAGIGISHWTKGTETGSWHSSKLVSASFTPAKKGYVMARVCIGSNKTIYVNPNLVIA